MPTQTLACVLVSARQCSSTAASPSRGSPRRLDPLAGASGNRPRIKPLTAPLLICPPWSLPAATARSPPVSSERRWMRPSAGPTIHPVGSASCQFGGSPARLAAACPSPTARRPAGRSPCTTALLQRLAAALRPGGMQRPRARPLAWPMLPCCHATLLPCYPAAMLPCCPVAGLSRARSPPAVLLPCCPAALSCCPVTLAALPRLRCLPHRPARENPSVGSCASMMPSLLWSLVADDEQAHFSPAPNCAPSIPQLPPPAWVS